MAADLGRRARPALRLHLWLRPKAALCKKGFPGKLLPRRAHIGLESGFGLTEGKLKTVITIDGPAGTGKTTVARVVARQLGFFLLDSGALYRAMALHLMRNGVDPSETALPDGIINALDLAIEPGIGSMRLFLGDEEVTEKIRTEEISSAASRFSARPQVRQALMGVQRCAGTRWDLVAEGRDMGTVVFPDATAKFFLTADLNVRAVRRHMELLERREALELDRVQSDMTDRDSRDQSRAESPLVAASDSVVIDTTELRVEEVVKIIIRHIWSRVSTPTGCGG